MKVNKKMFTKQFLDLMSLFIYEYMREKKKTKANIRKSIQAFEITWLEMLRGKEKNAKRKI